MRKPHIDYLRFEEPEDNNNLTLWGPYQRAENEPLQRIYGSDRGDGHLSIHRFYHGKLVDVIGEVVITEVKVERLLDGEHRTETETVFEFAVDNDGNLLFGEDCEISGKIEMMDGIMLLRCKSPRGRHAVYCTYGWENA